MRTFKRGSVWYVEFSAGGRVLRKSLKTTNKKLADQLALAMVTQERLKEEAGHRPSVTLGEVLERFQALAKRTHKRPQHVAGLCRKIMTGCGAGRFHLKADLEFHKITSKTVADLVSARLSEGDAPATINQELACLRRAYNLASKDWELRVCLNVKFPRQKAKAKLRFLTVEEEHALLEQLDPSLVLPGTQGNLRAAIKRRDQYDLTVALLDTGARYSEMAQLPWSEVDTRTWEHLLLYRWKVDNVSEIALTSRLRTILQDRYAQSRGPFVFPSPEDPKKPRGHAIGGITKAISRAGLNSPEKVQRYGTVTPHTFRDTFASRMASLGMKLEDISKLLGHTTLQQTAKYAHLVEKPMSMKAAALLDQLHGEHHV